MSVASPNPALDAHGLPLCNQDGCGLYDGKRCSAMGFKPDRFCEPELVGLVAERKKLTEERDRLRKDWDNALAAATSRIHSENRRLFAENSALRNRSAEMAAAAAEYPPGIQKQEPVLASSRVLASSAAVTIESPPPEDLLDRITPEPVCGHTRRSLRPDPQGNPVTTCIDCGDEIP